MTDPNTILRAGSKLVYHRLPWKEPEAPYLLEVLHEDDDMIALNKPSGLQVLPWGLFQQRTVLTQLQWHANNSQLSQEPHPIPVHRLGRGTSGLIYFSCVFGHSGLTTRDEEDIALLCYCHYVIWEAMTGQEVKA